MSQEQIAQVIQNNDASSVLVSDWSNRSAVMLMCISLAAIAVPIFLAIWASYAAFLWIIVALVGYGLYLGLSNEVVYYADAKDIWNIVFMAAAPFGILIVGATMMPEDTSSIWATLLWLLISSLAIAAAAWFGIKSTNATVLMNSGVETYKLVAVSMSKVLLVFLFAFLMIGNLNRTLSPKKPGDFSGGLMVLGILIAAGAWLYPKLVNAQSVFEKRAAHP